MSDSDSDWGSGSDEEEEEIVSGNVWNKYGVGVTQDSGGKNESVKSKKMKADVAVEFKNGFSYNSQNFTAKIITKMPRRVSSVIPTFCLLDQFQKDDDFENEFELDEMEIPLVRCGGNSLVLEKKRVIIQPVWLTKFAKTVPNQKFRSLGEKASIQTRRTVSMLQQHKTQELYGEHNWENVKFDTLTLPLEDENFCIIFVKPVYNNEDMINQLESKLFKRGYNSVGQILSEQREYKMSEILIPAVSFSEKNVDMASFLKRCNFRGLNSHVMSEMSFKFNGRGKNVPTEAPRKFKQKYKFFKSELKRPVRNVREINFHLDCPFLFLVVELDKSGAALVVGRYC